MIRETKPAASAAKPQGQKVNPEINDRLNAYMAENPGLVTALRALPKEQLVRKVSLSHMFRAESQAKQFDQKFEKLMSYVQSAGDNKLKERVDNALKSTAHPAHENRRIAASIVNKHAANQMLKQSQGTRQGITQ